MRAGAQEAAPQAAPAAASVSGTYHVGGVDIQIPPPATLVDIGQENNGYMELCVPSGNRLVAGFMTPAALPQLAKFGTYPLDSYAMVQVLRQAEFTDCAASDFQQVVDGMKQNLGDVMDSSTQESQDEINHRLKSMDVDQQLTLAKPVQLGMIFTKTDAAGFGLIVPVKFAGKSVTMAGGCALVRVHERMLFFYLYARYKDASTIDWLRKATEAWADAALAANAN